MKSLPALLLLSSSLACSAQTVTTVETYGPVPAAQVYDSLGTNISPLNEWEYQAAQAAHMTWGRFDCSWQNTELQNLPQNTSGGYRLPRQCAAGLAFGKIYGIHSIVDALYGAPSGKIASAVTTADSRPGATVIPLKLTAGSFAYVVPGQSYLKLGNGNISSKHAYVGTLITSKSGDSMTLASALTVAVPAGSAVVIYLQLYAPVMIAPSTSYLSNASIQAYENYVHFLQTQVGASGFPGRVSVWNEPPWSGDPWDEAGNLYDTPPPQTRMTNKFGVELAYAALALPPVPGATLDNGYSNKTGSGSVLNPGRRSNLASPNAVRQSFSSESFHPYGNNPEDAAWIPSCIQTHGAASLLSQVGKDCTPQGMVTGSNAKWQAAFSQPRDGFRGPDLGITETGLDRASNPTATETEISRFNLRQFFVFAGAGVHPILFYRLAGDPYFAWLHPDHSPYPVYTAFKNVMADIQTIARPPVAAYPVCATPAVQSYAGSYPLAVSVLAGSREGDRANSFLLYTWQRSHATGRWVDLPSPEPAKVSLSIPEGFKVLMVKDTVTSSAIPYKVDGRSLSYRVADNPIEALFSPASSSVSQAPCR